MKKFFIIILALLIQLAFPFHITLATNDSVLNIQNPNSSDSFVAPNGQDSVKFFVEFTDNKFNAEESDFRKYTFDLYKEGELINTHVCSTKITHTKYECYIKSPESGEDYQLKMNVTNSDDTTYSDNFSIENNYIAPVTNSNGPTVYDDIKITVVEENIRQGDVLNVEYTSDSCKLLSFSPWIRSDEKNDKGNNVIINIMDVDFNGLLVPVFNGEQMYSSEFLRTYYATNKNNFSFTVPRKIGYLLHIHNDYGVFLRTVKIKFFANNEAYLFSEMAHFNDQLLSNDTLPSVTDGQYKIFIKGKGKDANNKDCIAYGFSNYFNISSNATSIETPFDYPALYSLSKVGHEKAPSTVDSTLSSQLSDTERDTTVSSIKNRALRSRLKGKIMLKVEDGGKAYYVHPKSEEMHYLGRPGDAFKVMREQGVGISNANLEKIPVGSLDIGGEDSDGDGLSDAFEDAIGTDKNKADSDDDGFSDKDELRNGYSPVIKLKKLVHDDEFGKKQKGMIFLQVEGKGEAWYINPNDGKRYFLGRPADAFQVMRNLGLGISNRDFDSMQ